LSATFQSLSVVLPTLGETTSLTHTIECLVRDLRPDLAQILIIVCDRSTPEAMRCAEDAVERYPELVSIHSQDLPYFGGAVRKAFELSTGSHTILMASDLETRPEDAPILVAAAKEHPDAVITASRWLGGGFEGYNPVKLAANCSTGPTSPT
jgi:glycosyltransferase involved in cell wall biosynthesis